MCLSWETHFLCLWKEFDLGLFIPKFFLFQIFPGQYDSGLLSILAFLKGATLSNLFSLIYVYTVLFLGVCVGGGSEELTCSPNRALWVTCLFIKAWSLYNFLASFCVEYLIRTQALRTHSVLSWVFSVANDLRQ